MRLYHIEMQGARNDTGFYNQKHAAGNVRVALNRAHENAGFDKVRGSQLEYKVTVVDLGACRKIARGRWVWVNWGGAYDPETHKPIGRYQFQVSKYQYKLDKAPLPEGWMYIKNVPHLRSVLPNHLEEAQIVAYRARGVTV